VAVICIETLIAAPVGVCFDLMRDVEVHTRSAGGTDERAVGGVTTGLLEAGDVVTWEAVHFGVRLRLTVQVTRCERPRLFVDELVRGPFRALAHRHAFRAVPGGTLMVDTFRYRAPLGLLGAAADKLFLERYLRRFLERRAGFLKRLAEEGATPDAGA
jgi:ligand-binding SRPBCC domain-containing protein